MTTSPALQTAADGAVVAPAEDPAGVQGTPAAQGDPQPSPTPSAAPAAGVVRADYAGRVRGNGGLIAISIRKGKAIAYFCDGRTEAWFQGKAGEELSLEGFGGATVKARLGGGKAAGELAIGGKRWDFTAPTVKKPSGLYRATALIRGAKLQAGWIYLPDGTRVGAATLDGNLFPAEIPEPGQKTVIYGAEVVPQDVDEFIGAY
ncbi:hypothetical protein [Streptosporangium sp. OZ121]|uniref:hypothetical protein n=1 Tax=Streptosporangium sp. OZ121 TaxID=3444183 RepID=UPI003F79A60D